LLLVACSTRNPQTNESFQTTQPPDTAIATGMNLTSTVSTTTIPIIANSLTVTPILHTPSPRPAVPFVITPNADQLARWQEYEKALAEKFLSHLIPEDVLCEWLLLGQSEQEVYVWVSCQSAVPNTNDRYASISAPGVIYLGTDGSVQNVRRIVTWTDDIHNHFPPDLQELLFSGEIKPQIIQMNEHKAFRVENPEPPLIVLDSTQTP